MIAAVNAWHAAVAALLLLIPPVSQAADDLPGAARELARKTAAFGRGPATITYRNLSSLPDSEMTQVRRVFETALPGSSETTSPVEVRLTLSENASQFLLVEEARKGDESQVWITDWKRSERLTVPSEIAVDRKLIWEQDEPILDVAFAGDTILVLTPSRIVAEGGPRVRQSVALAPVKPWPRDLRGRLRLNAGLLQAFLPGLLCNGGLEPALSLECRPSEEPWVLESGSRAILLASFAPDRNYFDGRVVTQNGVRKSVAPFYSAAAVEEEGGTGWLLALLDGSTEVLDPALEPVARIPSWGSDLAGTNAQCGGGSQVLATRAGDANEADAVQAFVIANRAAVQLAPAVTFPGPVTALWPSTATTVLAVARDLSRGKYAAYVLTLVCGP